MSALAVVVPCRDRAALLDGCLAALGAAGGADLADVIVVDAASRTGDVAAVAARHGARCVRDATGTASSARNTGWRVATADLVAFVDDDVRVVPTWPAELVAALDGLDAVCGRVLGSGSGHLSVLDAAEPRDYRASDPIALWGHGANLGVRRRALEAVGGWDEGLGPGTRWPGGEDKELVDRLLRKGFRVGYRPGPTVEHLQWRTRRQALSAEYGYARGAGALAVRGRPASAVAEVRQGWADLRAGYQYGAVAGLVRAAGVVVGRATARGARP